MVETILDALGVPRIGVEGFEADDVIATLATRCAAENRECWIVSGDKDLLQLVGGSVKALRPNANFAFDAYGSPEVEAEWGVPPLRILDYLSLTGDASDNIPGVPGIGDKTALKLLTEYGSLESIYEKLDAVKPDGLKKKLEAGRESAELSRKLITLRKDVALPFSSLDELEIDGLRRRAANPIFLQQGMKSLVASAAEAGVGAGSSGGDELFAAKEDADAQVAGSDAAPSIQAAAVPPELLGPGDYEAVVEPVKLHAWVDACLAAGTFAFDCETDSLDDRRARPVGFSLSYEPKKACYVPLKAPEGDLVCPEETAKAELRRLFAAEGSTLIGQNVKYDYAVMGRYVGPMRNRLYDTMIASWLLDAEAESLGLEALAERRLGYHGVEYKDIVPKGQCFDSVPPRDGGSVRGRGRRPHLQALRPDQAGTRDRGPYERIPRPRDAPRDHPRGHGGRGHKGGDGRTQGLRRRARGEDRSPRARDMGPRGP